MKTNRFLIALAFLTLALMVFGTGCKYDVAEPQWDKPYTNPPEPKITSINPSQEAAPGINTITIQGENFSSAPGGNLVYFDKLAADIISSSPTSITVRRPNLVSDSSEVKVVSDAALSAVKVKPYKIDAVTERYGSFLDNLQLSTVAIDNAENMYVTEYTSRNIYKVTPDGQKTTLGTAARIVFESRMAPGGKLLLVGNNRSIEQVDLATGATSEWVKLPSGKIVKFGDFDANGYFYTGGTRSGLVVVNPDLTTTSFPTTAEYYGTTDDIQNIRVYNGYLYLVVANIVTTPVRDTTVAIWRHQLLGNGTLGAKELFLNWEQTPFVYRPIKGIDFSTDGKLYIGTDAADPLLVYDPSSGNLDYFYKSIVPSNIKQLYWGNGNYLYIIRGDTNLGQDWTIYRVNMGKKSSPYFGG